MLMTTRHKEIAAVFAAMVLAALILGSGNLGAVLARAGGAGQAAPSRVSGWHGAGPGLQLPVKAGASSGDAQAEQAAVAVSDDPDPYRVDRTPTITVQKIEAVLADYRSPAVGTGQAFYDLGVKYGINPAVALAFFIQESSAGTKGVARVTKSIGNIRTTPGYKDYQGYRAYDSWETGIEDYYKLIRDLYVDGWGLHTVAQVLPRYAPPADNNDTPAYINRVQDLITGWR